MLMQLRLESRLSGVVQGRLCYKPIAEPIVVDYNSTLRSGFNSIPDWGQHSHIVV